MVAFNELEMLVGEAAKSQEEHNSTNTVCDTSKSCVPFNDKHDITLQMLV